MSDWKPYFGKRLCREHPHGFVVIVPEDDVEVVPLACPVCDMLMSSSDDSAYFRQKKCCYKCGIRWADAKLGEWLAGWRPDANEIMMEVETRKSIPVALSLDLLRR